MLVDRLLELIGITAADGADRHDFPAGKTDGLVDGRTIIDDVTDLDRHLGLEAARVIRQAFDRQQIVARHGTRNCECYATGAGCRDKTGFSAREPCDDWARLAMKRID